MSPQITWQAMTPPKQTWWRAAYNGAVAGTIRGLALIIDCSPERRRPA